MSGCQSTTKKRVNNTQTNQSQTTQSSAVKNTAEPVISKTPVESAFERLEFYLSTAQLQKAQVLSNALSQQPLSPAEAVQLRLHNASLLLSNDQYTEAEALLVSTLPTDRVQLKTKFMLQLQIYQASEQHVKAITTLFQLMDQFNDSISAEILAQTWFHLNQLPELTLRQFETEYSSTAQAWINLAILVRQHIGDPVELHESLKRWQQQFPDHPPIDRLPQDVQHALTVQPWNPEKVAVLLPFTGKYRRQALAIRNGLLTANQRQNRQLTFINSHLDFQNMKEEIASLSPDFVIGPLLKETIDRYTADEYLQTIPTLFLNTPQQKAELTDFYYFGLNPDDEIEQLALLLREKNIQFPAVVAANNSQGVRLSNQFAALWKAFSPQQADAEQLYFSNKQEMQTAIKDLMDVTPSKDRIKTIERIIKVPLKTEARNRRDLDAIILIANPIQTRLLKPYIDVNTSPFATPLPVYATSKSHSSETDNVDRRDLNALIFTELPWMLPQNDQFNQYRQQYQDIWASEDEDLQRLFALGFDALESIPALAQLRVLSGQYIQGMTGQLSVAPDGVIKRQHSLARYTRGKIEIIKRH